MDNPMSYTHVNYLQRFGARQALQEFGSAINWRRDGLDSVLDAGCGPGDVTVDILMSVLPADFSRLVGVDISEAMLNYARKTCNRLRLSFELFDLSKDLEKQSFRSAEPFDHIFSFYVLMWIPNLETCIQNFYKLLVPNGDMLLLYCKYPAFDVYKEQSFEKRWSKYMWDVDEKSPPFQHSNNLRKDICDLLNNNGFCDCDVRIRKRNIRHENIVSLREFLIAVSAFLDRIPIEDREAYIDDVMQKMVKRCIRPNGDGDGDPIVVPYSDVIIYAQKS